MNLTTLVAKFQKTQAQADALRGMITAQLAVPKVASPKTGPRAAVPNRTGAVLSPATRKKMSDAAKKRWAARRAGK